MRYDEQMTHYLLDGHKVTEAAAASAWMRYSETSTYDMPTSISIWQDATTREGEESRAKLRAARIEVCLEDDEDEHRPPETHPHQDQTENN